MRKTINMAFWGSCNKDLLAWTSWLEFIEYSIPSFGTQLTHMGVLGEEFKSGKALVYTRAVTRVKKSLEEGKSVLSVEGYAVPKDFNTVSFDYEAYTVRNSKRGYVLLSVLEPAGELLMSDEAQWRERIGEQISVRKGEIFTMGRDESSAFYVAGMTPSESYRSLEVLKMF